MKRRRNRHQQKQGETLVQRFHRRSIRVMGYDYSQTGAYFITLCTWQKSLLFGEIFNNELVLNVFGRIALDEIKRLPVRFTNIRVESFVVMPDHIHMIIEIIEGRGTTVEQTNLPDRVFIEERETNDEVDRCAPTRTGAEGRGTTIEQSNLPDRVFIEDRRTNDEVDRCAPVRKFGNHIKDSISTIVRAYKATVSWRLHKSKDLRDHPIWQRNYYEHIIRNQKEWERIRAYIEANPIQYLRGHNDRERRYLDNDDNDADRLNDKVDRCAPTD